MQTLRIVAIAMQFHRQISAFAEGVAHPGALLYPGTASGQPQGENSRHTLHVGMGFEIGASDEVLAFAGGAARLRNQLAQMGIAGLGLHQQYQPQAVLQFELAANDQLDVGDFRSHQRPHDASQRTLVGDGQCFVAALCGAGEQRFGTGGATQEREIRQAMQLGVRGQRIARVVGRFQWQMDELHANHPCSIQPSRSPTGANAQACWPCAVSST
jgi:hypothetical protein